MEVKVNKLLAGLFTAAFLSVGLAAHAATQTIATGTVTYDTGGPVVGATVECHTANGSFFVTDETDSSGNYACAGDTASLVVGTTGIVVEVRAVEGYNTPGSYNFTWQGTAASNNFELITAGYTVNVTVHDVDGNPIVADVVVQPINVQPGDTFAQASGATDEGTGTDSIAVSFPNAIVIAEANLSEANPDRYPWIAIGGAQEVHFTDTVTEVDLDFTVVKSNTKVTVKLIDADGNILTQNNFTGDAYFEGYNEEYGAVSTRRKINNLTGVAEVHLLPGVWHVTAIHQQLSGQSFDPEQTTFVVSDEPGTTDWGTIQAVENNGTLQGKATIDTGDEAAGDLSNITISAINLDTNNRFSSTMESNGNFTINNVALGTYSITVDGDNFIPTATALVEVTANKPAVENIAITAQLADTTIKGQLVDSQGEAVTNFSGIVVVESANGEFSSQVAPDGSYSVDMFNGGIKGDEATVTLVTQEGAEGFATDKTFTVQDGDVTANLTLNTNEGTITGSIKNEAGATVAADDLGDDAKMMAINTATGSVETVSVAADGSYSLDVGPGTWNLVSQIADPTAAVYAGTMSGTQVQVTAGEDTAKNVTVFQEQASITGTITDSDGNPVPEAPVVVTNLPALQEAKGEVSPEEIVSVTTTANSAGEVSVDVPVGEYTLIFGTTPDISGQTAPETKVVTVTANQDDEFTAEFQDNNNTSLEGTVDGKFDSATVTAYSADGGSETADVNKNGAYSLELAPGDWDTVVSGVKNDELYVQQGEVTVQQGDNDQDFSPAATGIDFPAAITISGSADEPISVSNTEGAKISLPAYAAAFDGEVTVTLAPVVSFVNTGDMSQLGIAYDVRVVDDEGIPITNLNKDATISLPLDEQLLGGVAETEVAASYYNEALGTNLFDGMASDIKDDTLVIQTQHLSRFSAATTGQVAFTPNPVSKKSLKVSRITATSAKLSWNKPTGSIVSRYDVQLRKKGVTKAKQWTKYKVTKTSKVINKLTAGTNYQFRVRACNAAGCGTFSDWVAFKTKK